MRPGTEGAVSHKTAAPASADAAVTKSAVAMFPSRRASDDSAAPRSSGQRVRSGQASRASRHRPDALPAATAPAAIATADVPARTKPHAWWVSRALAVAAAPRASPADPGPAAGAVVAADDGAGGGAGAST